MLVRSLRIIGPLFAGLIVTTVSGCAPHDAVVRPEFEDPGQAAIAQIAQDQPAAPLAVTEPAEPGAQGASHPGPTAGVSISLISPESGARVSQFGQKVQFALHGKRPEGSTPLIMVQDATELSSNWWATYPAEDAPGEWSAAVPFGESRDSGASFAVEVLLLKSREDGPEPGSCGSLPEGVLARSAEIHVTRD